MTNSSTLLNLASAVRSIPVKQRGYRGYFPSTKVKKGIVEYDSQIERDFFLLLDHAEDVVTYQHQPVKIKFVNLEEKTLKARLIRIYPNFQKYSEKTLSFF